MLNFENFIENGMPTNADVLKAEKFEEFLNENIKGEDIEKPNALFLARITWNETQELIWRVYDAELVNNFLEKIVEEKKYHFEFDYKIEDDEDWSLAEWHLESVK